MSHKPQVAFVPASTNVNHYANAMQKHPDGVRLAEFTAQIAMFEGRQVTGKLRTDFGVLETLAVTVRSSGFRVINAQR